MDVKEPPYLYLLMRNDLDSMNSGKAVAHGAHAANQFTHELDQWTDDYHQRLYQSWKSSAKGFGTTITLHVSLKELQTAVAVARAMGFPADETVDPSYPYIIHREYAKLIQHPENMPPVPMGKSGNMLCLREEITAGYVFGDKNDLKPILGNFPLMP